MSTINNIKQTISLDITNAVRRIAEAYGLAKPDEFTQELLVHLGVVERDGIPFIPQVNTNPVASTSNASVTSTSEKKERKRMVSAKQKKDYLLIAGATAENLEAMIKGYKEASQETIDGLMTTDSKENAFILYAKSVLTGGSAVARAGAGVGPVETAPEPVKKQKKGPSQKVTSRVKFNATEMKIFKKVVGEGVEVTDELKKEFKEYVDAKSDAEFAVLALEGHMRAFVDSKVEAEAEEAEKADTGADVDTGADADNEGDEDDEDLVEFTHNEEVLLKGVISGKIFRSTKEAGDVQVGVAGKGQFKDVKV
jgi:hypothetical protein